MNGHRNEGSASATYSGEWKNGEASVKITVPDVYEKELQLKSQITPDMRKWDLYASYDGNYIHLNLDTMKIGHFEFTSSFTVPVNLSWRITATHNKYTADIELKVNNESYGAFGAYYETGADVKTGFVFTSNKFQIQYLNVYQETPQAKKFSTTIKRTTKQLSENRGIKNP